MTATGSICRSCSAPITWGESASGKRTPFNEDGSSHFSSCPQSREWRKPASNGTAATAPPPSRDREIRRMAVLKAAATFAAGKCLGGSVEVKSSDVLAIAESWEQWVLKGGTDARS